MTEKAGETRMWVHDEDKFLEPIDCPDLVKLQKRYLERKFNKKPSEIDPREPFIGAVGELGEIALNSDFLSWKTKNDKANILEEITDLLFFVLELYLIYGVESLKDVAAMYIEKRERNLARRDHNTKW